MRASHLLLTLTVVAGAVLLLAYARVPGEAALEAAAEARAQRLPGMLMAASQETCATCHYAWDEPYVLNASRSDAGEDGLVEYRVEVRPFRDYHLWDVRAAPRFPGGVPPQDMGVAREIDPALGQTVTVPWRVSGNLTSLAVRLLHDDEYARPLLGMRVVGPDGTEIPGEGERNHKIATVPAPAPGDWRVEVTYVEGGTPTAPSKVHFAETKPGWTLAPRVAYGDSAEFSWRLPPPGAEGAPEGFLLKFRVFNPHPTALWTLPSSYDNAWFTVWVPADGAPPAPPRAWTDEEIAAIWAGKDGFLIHEETVDVTRVVTRNERGEWGGTARYHEPPPAEAAFPAIPPGTRFIRAEFTVESRTPVSPVPDFYFTVSRRPDPTFLYPEPQVQKPDGWIAILPVSEEEWEDPEAGTGWFQGFARIPPDPRTGTAAFDGRYHFAVEALREAPAEWTQTGVTG